MSRSADSPGRPERILQRKPKMGYGKLDKTK
jgi:hypothetical protein